jgi:putative ABC transport system permease protein
VITVRTQGIVNEARRLLAQASSGLAVIAAVSLTVSLLVLVSVVATSRVRHVYDASVLHTLGARVSVIRRALQLEYTLIAALTTVFAVTLGGAIAYALLDYRLRLESDGIWWLGVATAVLVSTASLSLGARYLLGQLRLSPALLLRSGG